MGSRNISGDLWGIEENRENAWKLETGEEHPDFPKKGNTDSINHKTGEPPTSLCKRLSCILNWAGFRAHRKGSTEKKANNSVEKWAEARYRQFTEEERQVANKYQRSPTLWKYTWKQPDAIYLCSSSAKMKKIANIDYWQRCREISTLASGTYDFL